MEVTTLNGDMVVFPRVVVALVSSFVDDDVLIVVVCGRR
jgi:seryl-tRNA synthetase